MTVFFLLVFPYSPQGTELRLFHFSYAKTLKTSSYYIQNVKTALNDSHFLMAYTDSERNAYLLKLNKNDLEEPQDPSSLGVRTVYGVFSHPNKGAYILSRKSLGPDSYLMREK